MARLNTLLEKKWIQPIAGEQDSRKKEYQITGLGKSMVETEIKRLEELLHIGKQTIGSEKI